MEYQVKSFITNSGNVITATATVVLEKNDESFEEVAVGDGPIDASFKAIEKIIGSGATLDDYSIQSVTEGKDAQGEAIVKLAYEGRQFTGRGLSTDIIESSILAYLHAASKVLGSKKEKEESSYAS